MKQRHLSLRLGWQGDIGEDAGGCLVGHSKEPEMTSLSMTGEMDKLPVIHADDGKRGSRQTYTAFAYIVMDRLKIQCEIKKAGARLRFMTQCH